MKNSFFKWLLIVLGTFTWSLTMVKSGLVGQYGMGFWGPNGHDGIWHIALAESLTRRSLEMPVFSGHMLQNYHIGFDLILALISRLTSIPILNVYFQLMPVVISLAVGILVYKFVFLWTKSEKAGLLSTFFVYFGGSLSWILGKGESTFWSQQAVSTLINPPFALSLVIFLAGLISLFKKKKILSILFFGILIAIKSYAGVLALGALFVSGIYEYLKNKNIFVIKVFLLSTILSLLLYLPLNKNSGDLLVWQPFWFLETMMGLSDRLGWERFYSAMINYKASDNFIKGVPAYLVAFTIFWVGNMGTRLFKEFLIIKWIKDYKNITYLEVFVSAVIVAGGLIPMLFLQKGTPWNTIQFFYYSLFFSSILAGIAIYKMNKVIIVLVCLFTLPTTFITLKQVYIPSRPPAKVSQEELSALKYLSKLPEGVVLTYPFDELKSKEAISNPPRPLYLYESTAYVSAFSGQKVFLEDQVNLDITGYAWKERRIEVESWYKESNQKKAQDFLKNNKIKYIYWIDGQRALLGEGQLGLKQVFENNNVKIYEVIIH